MTEIVCGECGNTWNPDAVAFRKHHGKCPICGSRARADVDIGVETISKAGETGITGDVTLSEGDSISLTQSGNNIEINVVGLEGITNISLPIESMGRPNTNPPDIVDQDNLTLYKFTLNTDRVTFKFPVPADYGSGDFDFKVIWTNDGGVDDNGKAVKWQLDYQVAAEGEAVSGNHANSPKTVEDIYTSASGWIEHRTPIMTIAEADFSVGDCIFIKLSAITPAGAALTCEPHMIGVCLTYNIQIDYS